MWYSSIEKLLYQQRKVFRRFTVTYIRPFVDIYMQKIETNKSSIKVNELIMVAEWIAYKFPESDLSGTHRKGIYNVQ